MVTLADIQKNEDIKALISAGNRYLAAMGFTEHGPRHVSYVSRTAAGILDDYIEEHPVGTPTKPDREQL